MFWEIELSRPKFKKFQEGTFHARKTKKPTLKKFLIFQEMELFCPKLKKFRIFFPNFFYISRENLKSLKNKNSLCFSIKSSLHKFSHLIYSSHSLAVLAQCNHRLVVLPYLKFPFELLEVHMLFTAELVLTATNCFIKASQEDGSSTLNFAGPFTDVRNTGPVHLFVLISLGRFYICVKALQMSTFSRL